MADGVVAEVNWSDPAVSRALGEWAKKGPASEPASEPTSEQVDDTGAAWPDSGVRALPSDEDAPLPLRSVAAPLEATPYDRPGDGEGDQASGSWTSGLASVRSTAGRRKRVKEKAAFLRLFHPDGVDWGENVGDYDAEALQQTHKKLSALFGERRRYFRVKASGFEHLPDQPVMLVSNHSGGTTLLDAFGLLYAWYDHFGYERPVHPAGHEMLLAAPASGRYLARRGVVRANRRNAGRVLGEWKRDLLVYPGGDVDVWRPYRDRYKVRFAGRTGYARLALQHGVPIVPVSHVGAHHTLRVLTDGSRFAKAIRLNEIARANIWPVHLSFPLGLAVGPVPHIPTPTTLRYRIGPVIWPEDVGMSGAAEPDSTQIEAFDARVRAAVQTGLDELAEEVEGR